MKYAMIYIASFTFGGVGAWSVAKYGSRLGLMDIPNERSSHEIPIPIPKGGGIGILAAFFVCSLFLSVPKIFWIPAVLLSLFTFWGDRSEIRPRTRLLFQFAVAVALLMGILWEKENGVAGYALILPLAIFVVGTANYYNFMDGINGIAGITGVIGFGLLAFYASSYSGADYSLVILSICISLSCLGFLPLNMPKAKVFMGDVGSVLLGFVFAAMVVLLSKSFLDFVCLAGFLFPFYADELTTLTVRIRGGDRLTKPHRRHLYQLLANEMRVDHWKVSGVYGVLQLIIGLSVLAIRPLGIVAVLFLLGAYFGGFILVSFRFRKRLEN